MTGVKPHPSGRARKGARCCRPATNRLTATPFLDSTIGRGDGGNWGMSDNQAGITAARWALLASVAVACALVSPAAGDPAGGARLVLRVFPGVAPGERVNVETVSFADPRRAPVQVVRGVARPEDAAAGVEILGFGASGAQQVRVVRGPVARLDLPWLRRVETVSFGEPSQSPVMVVRGGLVRPVAVASFNAAAGGQLHRIRF